MPHALSGLHILDVQSILQSATHFQLLGAENQAYTKLYESFLDLKYQTQSERYVG